MKRPKQSIRNPICLVAGLLRFARNDEELVIARRMQWAVAIYLEANLDCFTAFAMTRSWSLWGECNESNLFEWQELYTLLPFFLPHEKAPYHSDSCTACLASFSGSGVSFWRGGKMSGKVRFFIIFRLAWACRKCHRNDRSDAESWLSQELRKLPWKQSYD